MAPDYTTAFLVSAFWLCFVTLFAIWAAWGLLVAIGIGYAADRALALDFRKGDKPQNRRRPDHRH